MQGDERVFYWRLLRTSIANPFDADGKCGNLSEIAIMLPIEDEGLQSIGH